MSIKHEAMELISTLPDDITLDELLAELQQLRGEERETDRTLLLKWFP